MPFKGTRRWRIALGAAALAIGASVAFNVLELRALSPAEALGVLRGSTEPSRLDLSRVEVIHATTNRFRVWDEPKVTSIQFQTPTDRWAQDLRRRLLEKASLEHAPILDDDELLANRVFPGSVPRWWVPRNAGDFDYLEIGQELWVFPRSKPQVYLVKVNY